MVTQLEIIAPSLDDIVKHNVRALIRRMHLNRDWIIGLIGDRGSGKSLGGSNIAIRDFAMSGEPIWSNMQIDLGVEVDDDIAQWYGLDKGGCVPYSSEYIDKQAFLRLDGRYEGGVLMFDEFNLEYGEARRAIANVNLMTDRAIQQLRKIQCGLVYTVLNEMYVDPRIRENTDVFIKCLDTALNPGALRERKPQGREFEWLIYAMSARSAGNGRTYRETQKPIGPIPIEMGSLWGIIDTLERQAVGATKYGETLLPIKTEDTPEIKQEKDKWAATDEIINLIYENHTRDGEYIEITSRDLQEELGFDDDEWGPVMMMVSRRLKDNIEKTGHGKRYKKYRIRNRILV